MCECTRFWKDFETICRKSFVEKPDVAFKASKEHVRKAAEVVFRSLKKELEEKSMSTEKGDNDEE